LERGASDLISEGSRRWRELQRVLARSGVNGGGSETGRIWRKRRASWRELERVLERAGRNWWGSQVGVGVKGDR
jgi:hypothetical protein